MSRLARALREVSRINEEYRVDTTTTTIEEFFADEGPLASVFGILLGRAKTGSPKGGDS